MFSGEYLLKSNPYNDTKVPVVQFTAEGGYYFKKLSDARKIMFVYARTSVHTMMILQANALQRKDQRKFYAMFRQFGKDSLLFTTLAYNVGPYRLLGSGKIPKSSLIRKLEAGDRNIYREYIAFCNYKGKRHAILPKRRKAEFLLLFIP